MKAGYLSLVYSIPLSAALVPADWFQAVWLWPYIPFGIVAAAMVWYRPDREMMLWIAASPLIFWVFINAGAFLYGLAGGPLEAAIQLLLLSLILSTPIGFLVGAYTVMIAILVFAVFRRQKWLA